MTALLDHTRRRLEFGDLLLYLYLITIVRQCFWGIGQQKLAWGLTLAAGGLVWFIYLTTREPLESRSGRAFWLIVGLPLLLVYGLRVVYPDVSFDVLNHHLFLSERALRGPLLIAGDFFPTPAPYNPAPDMLTGIFRYCLGYRLGTIVNLLVLLWSAQVIDKLLRPYLRTEWRRALAVLLCVFAEHLLFQINNYMVDLIALPLTLEATRLALTVDQWEKYRSRLIRIAFLCGLALAMKLTNAAMIVPIILVCAFHTLFRFRPAPKQLAGVFLLTLFAFIAPLLPYSIFIYRQTGSPFFPVYNGIFKSPYWPISNTWDPRWGPQGAMEVWQWPFLLPGKALRLSELGVYSGRITAAVLAVLLLLLLWRRRVRSQTVTLAVIVLLTAFLWSLTTGYIRYALHLEVLAGVLLAALAAQLAPAAAGKARPLKLVLPVLLWLALGLPAVLACVYISQKEWSLRATYFDSPRQFLSSAKYLLRDYSIRTLLTPTEIARYDSVDVWVVSGMKTVGPESLLNERVPFISVRVGEYFSAPGGAEKFNQALDRAAGKRLWSLCFKEELESCLNELQQHGLAAGTPLPVELPFFSPRHRIPMFFFEVRRSPTVGPVAQLQPADRRSDNRYTAEISAVELPPVLQPGEKRRLLFRVKNTGTMVWPARVPKGWMKVVTMGDRWLTSDGARAVNELDSRTALPHDLKPGDATELELTITAPSAAGQYVLEIDMVHEGVAWFSQLGSPTLRWTVRIAN
jgi:hypothetical protein